MKLKLLIGAFLVLATINTFAQIPGKMAQTGQVLLPNGWKLNPADRSLPLGDLPLNIQLSASGHLMAVTNNGESTQSIQLLHMGSTGQTAIHAHSAASSLPV